MSINEVFGNKLRIRVSGILIENEEILVIQHKDLGPAGTLWAPPGGGVEFGASIEDNLKREFLEETGLLIEVEHFLFVNEVLLPPLHAIELFFLVKKVGGKLKLGGDPEMNKSEQILQTVQFLSFKSLKKIDENKLHNLFRHCTSISELLNMKGYFNY